MNQQKQHTPGPWRWFGSPRTGFYLATVHHGRRFVMQFSRLGMHDAQPVFQSNKIMVKGSELCRFEVAPEIVGMSAAMKNRKRVYRFEITEFDNPDARLIAAAPEILEALEKMIAFVGSLGMEFGCVTREKLGESYDVMKSARKAIDKVNGDDHE